MVTTPMPDFTEFYRALNGRDPFPWQARLARCIRDDKTGRWPEEIAVPTGLGKTACLEIAVWHLASQAHRSPAERTAPTRIWWVVNRRLLVDSTATHAEAIAGVLADPESAGLSGQLREAVASVAHRLRSLNADPGADPLHVIRLRGGIASRTPIDPACPTIVLCTLPMYGSRLLFRGYGSRLPVVDAAMAGTDSLVLLDEAHLAPHLRALVPALSACIPGARNALGEARSGATVVALTATPDGKTAERLDLDTDDEANPIVRQRLDAVKPLTLREEEKGNSAALLAEAALVLLGETPAPATCLVFANTPKTARETFNRLRRAVGAKGGDVWLLTGRVREREAERIRAHILHGEHGMAADRAIGVERERHLIVVATQTLEVGADIDAQCLVSEACGVRALTQRLGRLNRFGRFAHARAAYVHVPPHGSGEAAEDADIWPVYGREPATVLKRLKSALGESGADTVDMCPRAVTGTLGPPLDDAGRHPEVLPEILREWTKTTIRPEGEAPVEPYFSGIAGPRYSVSLIWRVHVPNAGERLWPRPADREAIDVPIDEVRKVLQDDDLRRLASDGANIKEALSVDLRPGDQIVLPTDRGLMDDFGWNPSAREPIVDISLAGSGLPLEARAVERLCGVELGRLVDTALGIGQGDEEIDQAERAEAVEEILAEVREVPVPAGWEQAEWDDFTSALSPSVHEARGEVPRLSVRKPTPEPRNDAFDEMSLGKVVGLDRHGQDVAARAEAIAERLGLPPDLAEVVARAAKLHDIGKADGRFQRWLDPAGERGLVAKSDTPRHRWEATRAASGWPRGGRHEDLSARLVQAWLEREPGRGSSIERDLLIHLVISHHGRGRPLVLPVSDGTSRMVSGVVDGVPVEAPADLAIVDWSQPARFKRLNEHFGPWGLALLEAIVIRADHAASARASGSRDAVE